MEDASALVLGLTLLLPLLGTLASAVVPVVLVVVLLRAFRGGGTPAAGRSRAGGCLAFVRGGMLLAVLPVSLFIGLMIATIGGVIHPPIVEVVLPRVCEGDARLHTEGYSYKPGQHGTSMVYTCTDASGESREITLKVLGAATLFYSAILAAILLPLAWLAGRFMRLAGSGVLSRSGDVNDALREFTGHIRAAGIAGDDDATGPRDAGNPRRPASVVTVNGRPLEADPALIDELLRAAGQRDHGHASGEATHAPPSDGDIGERLLKLRELHRSGAIGDADYEAKKAALLREL